MLPCDQTSKQPRLPLCCAARTLRSLNGTFVPALSSLFIVERRLWIRSKKTVGAQRTDLGRKNDNENQAFMDFAWSDAPADASFSAPQFPCRSEQHPGYADDHGHGIG